MKIDDPLSQLVVKVHHSYQDLCHRNPEINILDHIFVSDDDRKHNFAETLVETAGDQCFISIRFSSKLRRDANELECPYKRLTQNNLGLLLIVSEEISHFHMICQQAIANTMISRFDLELQSEFDKFIIAADLMQKQTGAYHSKHLARLIYDSSVSYVDDEIYDDTGRLAAAWWWSQINHLGDLTLHNARIRRALFEMRHLQGAAKLQYLNNTKAQVLRSTAS